MKMVYDKINDMRGNLITVTAQGVGLRRVCPDRLEGWTISVYASVMRIEGEQVTLQVFQNTRGISTDDQVTFLTRQMQATLWTCLLGRRLSGSGVPIDGGPEIVGEEINIGAPLLIR